MGEGDWVDNVNHLVTKFIVGGEVLEKLHRGFLDEEMNENVSEMPCCSSCLEQATISSLVISKGTAVAGIAALEIKHRFNLRGTPANVHAVAFAQPADQIGSAASIPLEASRRYLTRARGFLGYYYDAFSFHRFDGI